MHFTCVLGPGYLQGFVLLENFSTLAICCFSSKSHIKYQFHFMAFPCCCLLFVPLLLPCHAMVCSGWFTSTWCSGGHEFPVFAWPCQIPALQIAENPHFLVCCTTPKSMSQMQTLPGLVQGENPTAMGKQQRNGLRNGWPGAAAKCALVLLPDGTVPTGCDGVKVDLSLR